MGAARGRTLLRKSQVMCCRDRALGDANVIAEAALGGVAGPRARTRTSEPLHFGSTVTIQNPLKITSLFINYGLLYLKEHFSIVY